MKIHAHIKVLSLLAVLCMWCVSVHATLRFDKPLLWWQPQAEICLDSTQSTFPIPLSDCYSILTVIRSEKPDSNELLWSIMRNDTLQFGVMTHGLYYPDAGVIQDRRRRDFSHWCIYRFQQGCRWDSTQNYTLCLGRNDTLTSRILMWEFLYFPKFLPAWELQVRQTALALKYGITLDYAPYLFSTGDTLWSETADETFYHRVIGVGCDTVSGLCSLCSQCLEDSTIEISVSSAPHGGYAICGDNGYSLATISRPGGEQTLERLWRIRTHGVRQVQISVQIDANMVDSVNMVLLDGYTNVIRQIPADSTNFYNHKAYFTYCVDTVVLHQDFTFSVPAAIRHTPSVHTSNNVALHYDTTAKRVFVDTTQADIECVYYLVDSTGKVLQRLSKADLMHGYSTELLQTGVYYIEVLGNLRLLYSYRFVVL